MAHGQSMCTAVDATTVGLQCDNAKGLVIGPPEGEKGMKHPSNRTSTDATRQEGFGTAVVLPAIMLLVVLAVLCWAMGSAAKWEREHGCVDYECAYEVY